MWRRAWVQGVDHHDQTPSEEYRVIQDEGRGLLMQGTREWTDYQVSARVTSHLIAAGGVGIRVQGMRRYYGLLRRDTDEDQSGCGPPAGAALSLHAAALPERGRGGAA